MRIILVLAICLIACTKKNPDLCCIDEADCANVGLDEVKGCGEGLLCRGNQCIAEVCESSDECDADAPYCVAPPDGRCQQTCTSNEECPGFGEDPTQTLCEAGSCVECRAGQSDCSASTPICDAGACVRCTRNDQCDSGVCVEDGTCADETDVAYVSPTGTPDGDCTANMPCKTIEFALALTPPRPFVVIDAGTYSRLETLRLTGNRRLIGRGATRPVIRRGTDGPIVTVNNGVFGLEFLDVAGATGTDLDGGDGLFCQAGSTIRIVDSVFRDNALNGANCSATLIAIRSSFNKNQRSGLFVVDANVKLDGCTASQNGKRGLFLDAGVYDVTNTIVARNGEGGILLFFNAPTDARVEFNTIVDNGSDPLNHRGFECASSLPGSSMPNNIIARNANQSSDCSLPNSIIIDTEIAALKFVSPDVEPFDYHIQAGSTAIDAATITTIDHDFDGDTRPSSGADVGADEL